jgi:hypothetical protein
MKGGARAMSIAILPVVLTSCARNLLIILCVSWIIGSSDATTIIKPTKYFHNETLPTHNSNPTLNSSIFLVPWKYLDRQPFLKYRPSYWALYTHDYTRGKWVAPSYCNDYFETRDLFHFHLMGRKLFPSVSHVKSSPAACIESVLWRNATTESAIYTT